MEYAGAEGELRILAGSKPVDLLSLKKSQRRYVLQADGITSSIRIELPQSLPHGICEVRLYT